MTDVALKHTNDGGEITFKAGQAVMCDGLENSVYLSLFGGNEDDSGLPGDDSRQFWGNLDETDSSKKFRSETQHLLRSIPATSANLRRIEDAASRDLDWMTDEIANSVAVEAAMPALNTVKIVVDIEVKNSRYRFTFIENWGMPS